MPKITVGIPVWNQNPEFFVKALESVINQTLSDELYEIIILDDGSDVPIQIELSKENKISIRVIRHKKNQGIGVARQAIVDNASKESEFITFLSSDDIWDQKFLETMMDSAKGQPNKILYSGNYHIDEEGKIIMKFDPPNYEDHEDFCIACWEAAYRNTMFVNFSCIFIPRKVFEKCKFKYMFGEDLYFLLFSMKHFEYHHINQPLVYYRAGGNLTSRIMDKIPKNNEKIRKEVREYWKENESR